MLQESFTEVAYYFWVFSVNWSHSVLYSTCHPRHATSFPSWWSDSGPLAPSCGRARYAHLRARSASSFFPPDFWFSAKLSYTSVENLYWWVDVYSARQTVPGCAGQKHGTGGGGGADQQRWDYLPTCTSNCAFSRSHRVFTSPGRLVGASLNPCANAPPPLTF